MPFYQGASLSDTPNQPIVTTQKPDKINS
jgi:hypothetical protein